MHVSKNVEEIRGKKKITCENEESNTMVISASTYSISSPNLQIESRAPSANSKVANVGISRIFTCLTEIQQPTLLRFDVPFHYEIGFSSRSDSFGHKLDCDIDFSHLHVDFIDYHLGCEPCIVFLVECRDYACSVELSLYIFFCRIYNEEEHELEDLSLARVKLGSLYAARFSSKKLTDLQLSHFSALRLHSAQLQLY
ncbi:hypothetical protein GQ457_03G017330 [Hibiscus cannabinus]